MPNPSKRHSHILHGSGQTWEILVPSGVEVGSPEWRGWMDDQVAEHDYWNEQAILKNEQARRKALKLDDESLRDSIVANLRKKEREEWNTRY